MRWGIRLHNWLDRHRRAFAVATWGVFAVICADYARFIDLPDLLKIPVWTAGILTGLRYALWDGLIWPRIRKRSQDQAVAERGSAS